MTCQIDRGIDNDLLLSELSHEVEELRGCLNRISLDARFLQVALGLGKERLVVGAGDPVSTKVGMAIANILCECSRVEGDVERSEVVSVTPGQSVIVTSEDPFGD